MTLLRSGLHGGIRRPMVFARVGIMMIICARYSSLVHAQATPSATSAVHDSAAVHKSLRKEIERFQDRWRKEWQSVEVKRHGMINLTQIRGWVVTRRGNIEQPTFEGDRMALRLTPELRRYLSILCLVETPSDRQIEATKRRDRNNVGSFTNGPPSIEVGRGGAGVSTMREPDAGSASWATPRIIREPRGSVCPAWLPDEKTIPLDEGEAIDLAIPPAGRAALRQERERLIQQLERAHAQLPTDNWIAGQRLRFVLDQRSPARGIDAARACAGDRGWCLRLVALAYDHADSVWAADSVYQRAEQAQAERDSVSEAACADEDALLLVSPSERSQVLQRPCSEQRSFVERLWWLADPLWSVAGNERLVAHRSRQTHSTLRSVLDRDERYQWADRSGGSAQRELVIRYGWPSYSYWPGGQFEEEMNMLRELDTRLWQPAPPYTAKEYSRDRQALLPSAQAISDPLRATPNSWQSSAPVGTPFEMWWPREHMMLGTQLLVLPEGQQAQLRRDSLVVFGLAVDNPLRILDTAAVGPSRAALVGSTSPTDVRMLARATVASGQTLRLEAQLASTPLVLSAEVQPRTSREPALRARFGYAPPPTLAEMAPQSVALSPPLLLRLGADQAVPPTDADSALSMMAGSMTLAKSARHAVYWEGYGFAPGDTVDIRLRISRNEQPSALQRLGEAIGVSTPLRDSVAVSWREPDTRRAVPLSTTVMPVTARAIALNLASLPPGSYRLAIEMRRIDGVTARSDALFILRD